MDFDEYEYLEKTVESAAAAGATAGANGEGAKAVAAAEDDGHKSEHRSSKRSRGDEERDRDKGDREKRSRREHRSSRYEREKDRDRGRGDDKEKSERDRDRDRDKERSRSRRDDRDKDSRRHSRDKEKEERASSKDREKDKDFRKSRERRDRKEESAPAESEPDPERDQRTVFAWQICLKADEKHVYDFFSKAGKVRDVRLIMDRNSRRSKGVGYIEFYDAMSVPLALQLNNQPLLGQNVMVKPSEAEKNLVHSASGGSAAGAFNGPYSGGARRLYVGNLHVNITEDQLRQVFEPFGVIELVQLPLDQETGLCKGYGFVQYSKLEDARAAQQGLNGILELAGRAIKVSAVTDQQTGQDIGTTQNDLDDDEGGGLALNARSRALLMQKLDRSGGVGAPASLQPQAPMAVPPVYGGIGSALSMQNGSVLPEEPIGPPSECLLLKNMFDPATETDPEFDIDIKNDVQDECSKFGPVKHISVDKYSQGHVYVRFGTAIDALAAQLNLNKRWFAGKTIRATFMNVQVYEEKFPESKQL
ncbi:hypothetical protein SELMODRAFT_151471 [Selaginella moellendorffii]|uniref:RRM domain-containing protein n=1 Tax=Selaginella moellendorffii TaxID=88036 RepID=D8S0D1_SELML|nr:RNA-binding protein 39 [Selaginella moellendorffii]XP_002980666.1 RNA-binding protein 39 [Selaginella moellendorffii]EFJ18317.1 hypothetical protein SELMODRAFT_178258 [Selaginella moellendorffii]EFJ22033.1 hypothetical protein SELMODRAFT_151471 [Selaginella moellendorffii]|eukprot:XP_002976923.1 RNA-binding protein 39 [Selaginella moellendorffii]